MSINLFCVWVAVLIWILLFTASLGELRKKCCHVRSLCWADTTWLTKRSQWKRYLTFCSTYDLQPAPASIDTVCCYITYLAGQVCYSTICNYISAVWSLHDFIDSTSPAKGSFLVKCTLKGARRLLGDTVLSADPLLPEHLMLIYRALDHKNILHLVFWTAITLAYRCLLRKGHYTYSTHMLRRQDVEFTDYGVCITLHSSKTIQYRERLVKIPVVAATGSALCPVYWLKVYFNKVRASPSAPLFIVPGTQHCTLSYHVFSKLLKAFVSKCHLKGRYSSHSLRRGSATYLSRLGLPLHDIKTYGDWQSLSVLLYLASDISSRLHKDYPVANSLTQFAM